MRLGPRLAALLLVGGLGILGLVHEDYYMELGPWVSGYRALRISALVSAHWGMGPALVDRAMSRNNLGLMGP